MVREVCAPPRSKLNPNRDNCLFFSVMLTAGLTCSAFANPLVDFVFLEFPETTDFVGRHGFFADPLADHILLRTVIVPNLIYE